MRRSEIKTGLLLACLPTLVLTLWVIVETLRHFPADGTAGWFFQGVFSLGLIFALTSGWHGLGAGLAVRATQHFWNKPFVNLRLLLIAATAASGSLIASLAACLTASVLFPKTVGGLMRIAFGGSLAFAVFFAAGFTYLLWRTPGDKRDR